MPEFKILYASFDSDPHKRGKQFEHFVKWFLKTEPEWSTQVEKIWLWKDYPDRWGKDCGIDLVFKHKNGETWAVQAKCYAPTTSITKSDMDTFLSESMLHGIDNLLLITTTNMLAPNAKQVCEAPKAKPVIRYMLANFESAAIEYPTRLEDIAKAKPKIPPQPRPHQTEAIATVAKLFKTVDRGQLIMACGTGKTYTTLWIKEKLSAQSTLVLLPSLGLLSQTLREWTSSKTKPFEVLCVCSDQTVGKKDEDESISSVADLAFPVTSDVKEIQKFIKGQSARVIFSTYQSSPLIAEAQKNKKLPAFDLVIADEAHRCTGKVGTDFSTVLDNKLIRAKKRLFATATPRLYSAAVKTAAEGRGVEMVGMDDETLFGKVLYSLPFGKAIAGKLLTDYQVIIIGVDNPMIAQWIKNRELLAIDPKNTMDAQTLASQIGLLKAINDYDLKRVISFHSRVNRAESFVNDIQKVNLWIPKKHRPSGNLITDFVSGVMPTDKRHQKLERLKSLDTEERGILSNARCLSEGVDVPSLDGVAFIDPRASQVDIIQAVGRAIRLSTNKKIGTIVLPVFIEDGENAQASIEASNFKPIWDVLYALKAHDDVLSQELDQARTALGKQALTKNKPLSLSKIVFNLPASVDISFSNALRTYLVEQVTEPWKYMYGLLLGYIEKHGNSRVPYEFNIGNILLGRWVSRQRLGKNNLSNDKIKLFDALPEWTWNILEDQWNKNFEYLKKFVQLKGHARVPAREIFENVKLGTWVSDQRKARKKLSLERIQLLENLTEWSWKPHENQWLEGLASLKLYIAEFGHTRVPNGFKYKGFNLGGWVSKKRRDKAKLAKEKIKTLESLPHWTWSVMDDQWSKGFEKLKKYIKENGHTRVPRNHKYFNFALGRWVQYYRSRGRNKIDPEKIKLLDSLPEWTWNVYKDIWNEGFDYLKKYVSEYGDALVPTLFKYGSYKLGLWVSRLRTRKDTLDLEKIKLLESLPFWSWNAIEAQWYEGFGNLKKYFVEKGNINIPFDFKYLGYNLGSWVRRQRKGKHNLELKQIKLLESMPSWFWGLAEDKWEISFKYLLQYVKEMGHAKVPVKLKYKNYKLGSWVAHQRSGKNKLSKERIKLLDSLPGWCWVANNK